MVLAHVFLVIVGSVLSWLEDHFDNPKSVTETVQLVMSAVKSGLTADQREDAMLDLFCIHREGDQCVVKTASVPVDSSADSVVWR